MKLPIREVRHNETKEKSRGDNPGKLLMRILGYVGKTYKVHLILVVIGIFVSVLANVQGNHVYENHD